MISITVQAVNSIYRLSGQASLSSHVIYHEGFLRFCRAVSRFTQELPDESARSFWFPFLNPMKRYRFMTMAAPVPFNGSQAFSVRHVKDMLDKLLVRAGTVYPDIQKKAFELLNAYNGLSQSSENPLLEGILSLLGDASWKASLLVKDSSLVAGAESIVKATPALRNVEILVPEMLRGDAYYRLLFVVGPARWFPDYVFTAPRAEAVHQVTYRWIKDGLPPKRVFTQNVDEAGAAIQHDESAEQAVGEIRPEDLLRAEDVLPTIDLRSLVAGFAQQSQGLEHAVEDVDARLHVLEAGKLVFLEEGEDNRVLVIDLEGLRGDGSRLLKRIPVSLLEVGMFVLLRTSGGGDYIIPVADRIMGENSSDWRGKQSYWKGLLKERVAATGLGKACEMLQQHGCLHASEVNVRHWMSERSLKTRDVADFEAIMRFIGLGGKAKEYWEVASAIERAHLKAGQHIRQLLLKQVLAADLRQLERLGKLDFGLPDADGGSLTAFRVKQILPGTFKVSPARIGDVFGGEP